MPAIDTEVLQAARAKTVQGTHLIDAIHEALAPPRVGADYPNATSEALFDRMLAHLAPKHRVCKTAQTCIAIWLLRHHRTQQDHTDLIDKVLAGRGIMAEAAHDRHATFLARQAVIPF